MDRSRLLRAAVLGAAIALVLGGCGAFYVGYGRLVGAIDCEGLSADECAFEHETFKTIGRVQTISGVAMFGLGVALYVLVRRQPEPKPADPGTA